MVAPAQTVPRWRRIYLLFMPGEAGRLKLRLSAAPPVAGGSMAALISRGMMAGDADELEVEIVSDPTADPQLHGEDASPAQIAQAVADYFAAHPVTNGKDGKDATNEQAATAVAAYLAAHPSTTRIGGVSVGQNATVLIALGDRELTANLAGAVKGGRYVATCDSHKLNNGTTVAGLPAGYTFFGVTSRADGQITAQFRGPALSIGASYQLNLSIHRLD